MPQSGKIKSRFLVNKSKENPFISGGLRSYREYRDFGIADITEGKVHVHLIKTTAPCPEGGSGLHYHDLEFQMVYCLEGRSTVWFEGHGEQHFEEGDCWVQPPCIKHNVLNYSDDYLLMEMTIPAEYETIQCDDGDD